MPMPNEHSARINSPGKYKKFRRKKDAFGEGVDAIYGITDDGKAEVQAIRFDKEKFTPAEAKKWLKDHDYKPISFEKASTQESISVRDVEDAIRDFLQEQIGHHRVWVSEIFLDTSEVVYVTYSDTEPDVYYRAPFAFDVQKNTATVDVSRATKVQQKIDYIPVEEAAIDAIKALTTPGTHKRLRENCIVEGPVNPDGSKWLIRVIELGWSLNERYYGDPRLDEFVGFLNNPIDGEPIPSYLNHPSESEFKERPERDIEKKAAFIQPGSAFKENGQAKAHLMVVKKWLREDMLEAYRLGNPLFHQFSIVADGATETGMAEGKTGEIVTKVLGLDSVDFVTKAAAGGRAEKLVASARKKEGTKVLKGIKTLKDFQEKFAGMASLILAMELEEAEKLLTGELEAEAELVTAIKASIQEAREAAEAQAKATTETTEQSQTTEETTEETPTEETEEKPAPAVAEGVLQQIGGALEAAIGKELEKLGVKESVQELRLASCQNKLAEEIKNAPVAMKDVLQEKFKGKVFKDEELTNAVEEGKKILKAAYPAGAQQVGTIQITETERDKHVKAMESAMLKESPDPGYEDFGSIRRAYGHITGDWQTAMNNPDAIFAAIAAYVPPRQNDRVFETFRQQHMKMCESIISTTFTYVFGDAMHKMFLKFTGAAGLEKWRELCEIKFHTDFRNVNYSRMGGYGALPTVAEGGTYQYLTTPSDERLQISLSKVGGLERISKEAVYNDDLGAIKEIIQKLGVAAAFTRNDTALSVVEDNDTCDYDSTALYASGHGNLGSSDLAVTTLAAGVLAMMDQTYYGMTGYVMGDENFPITLGVSNENFDLGWQLCFGEWEPDTGDRNENVFKKMGASKQLMLLPTFTSSTKWFLFRGKPLIMAFLQGKPNPELWVQDMPQVGSMFNLDSVTYKINDHFAVGIKDHRLTYRGGS